MRVLMGLFWVLVIFCILTAQPGRGDTSASRNAPRDWPAKPIEGLGLDVQNAKENAWKEAHKQIVVCLNGQKPPVKAWIPTLEYVKKNLIAREEPGKDLNLEPGSAKRWIVFLKTPDWDALYRFDKAAQAVERKHRAEERMILLAKMVGGLLALLAGVVGTIRLDDLTRRHYTRWLQIAGAGLIAVAWAGLWFIS